MRGIIVVILSIIHLHGCAVSTSSAGGFASASEIASPAAGIRCFAISDVNNNVIGGSCLVSP